MSKKPKPIPAPMKAPKKKKPPPKRKQPPISKHPRVMVTKAPKKKTARKLSEHKLSTTRAIPAKKKTGRNGVKPKSRRPNGVIATVANEKLEELAEVTAETLHDIVEVGEDGKLTRQSIRRMMQVDYIQDHKRQTLKALWSDPSRPYGSIPWQTVRDWSGKDSWEDRRKDYWRRVTQYALNRFMQERAHSLMREVERVSESLQYLEEYMLPMKDGDGKIRRHESGPYLGLPVYPLEMPSQDKAVDMILKLYKHRLTLIGAATAKVEAPDDSYQDAPVAQLDPVAQNVELTAEELDMLANSLLKARADAHALPSKGTEDE